jgi:hypothetical protein
MVTKVKSLLSKQLLNAINIGYNLLRKFFVAYNVLVKGNKLNLFNKVDVVSL